MGSGASVSETARKNNLLGIRLAGYFVFNTVIFTVMVFPGLNVRGCISIYCTSDS